MSKDYETEDWISPEEEMIEPYSRMSSRELEENAKITARMMNLFDGKEI